MNLELRSSSTLLLKSRKLADHENKSNVKLLSGSKMISPLCCFLATLYVDKHDFGLFALCNRMVAGDLSPKSQTEIIHQTKLRFSIVWDKLFSIEKSYDKKVAIYDSYICKMYMHTKKKSIKFVSINLSNNCMNKKLSKFFQFRFYMYMYMYLTCLYDKTYGPILSVKVTVHNLISATSKLCSSFSYRNGWEKASWSNTEKQNWLRLATLQTKQLFNLLPRLSSSKMVKIHHIS